MAHHVPMRIAQPGLMAHQQRPPMMVTINQPPPVSIHGLATGAPVMTHGGGMAVMSHPEINHSETDHSMTNPGNLASYHNMHPGHHATQHIMNTRTQVSNHSHPNGHSVSQPHSQYQNVQANRSILQTHQAGAQQSHISTTQMCPPQSSNQVRPQMSSQLSYNRASPSQVYQQQNIARNGFQNYNSVSKNQAKKSYEGDSYMFSSAPSSQTNPSYQPAQQSQPYNSRPYQQGNKIVSHAKQATKPVPQAPVSHLNGNIYRVNHNSMIDSQSETEKDEKDVSEAENSDTKNEKKTELNEMAEMNKNRRKEKTPMCLVNEIAKYNKVSPQYFLINEIGPPHKKEFTLALKFQDEKGEELERFSATGLSMKKAQLKVAEIALEKTKLKKPPPKVKKPVNKPNDLSPTVELNALAMKRKELVIYKFNEPVRQRSFGYPLYGYRGGFRPRFYGNNQTFTVTLSIGIEASNLEDGTPIPKEFTGEGPSPQAAKLNAASKALNVLKTLPMPKPSSPNAVKTKAEENLGKFGPNYDETKSPVSLVHEIALRRQLPVSFIIVKEFGAPHMRVYLTECIVGNVKDNQGVGISVLGEGTAKRISKNNAATGMLEELKKLPPVPITISLNKLKMRHTSKKRTSNVIRPDTQKEGDDQAMNPITRLIQIQQAKRKKEPVFTLVSEQGSMKRREFVIQVTIESETAEGMGKTKKWAKKAAAENMLQKMGYSQLSDNSCLKNDSSASPSSQNMQASEGIKSPPQHRQQSPLQSNEGVGGRQLVPGLLMVRVEEKENNANVNSSSSISSSTVKIQSTAAMAKEILKSGILGTVPNGNSTANLHQQHTQQKSDQQSGQQQKTTDTIENGGPTEDNLGSEAQPQPTKSKKKRKHKKQTQSDQQNASQQQENVLKQQNVIPQQVGAAQHPSVNQRNLSQQQKQNVSPMQHNFPQPQYNASQQQISHQVGQLPHQISNGVGQAQVQNNGNPNGQAVRPKDQLLYLANFLGIQVQFSDFPKVNKNEVLSLVSLATTPPHTSHGSGPTLEASHDQACLTALRALAELGLDNVSSSPSK